LIPAVGEAIEVTEETITSEAVASFRAATQSDHSTGIPATFSTRFRHAEFEWLDRLEVDMHNLLHTEQEYEYHEPFRVGDTPVVRTSIKDYRERVGKQAKLVIIVFESQIRSGQRLNMTTLTTFVVRSSVTEASHGA